MGGSQLYIGTKNGVVVCVDEKRGGRLIGRFYHGYARSPVVFRSDKQLVFELEALFNELNHPHPSTNDRYFSPSAASKTRHGNREKKVKTVADNELLQRRGNLGSFIIRVQHRQNSSWQGRITWMDENKTVSFRSVWEMVKLMENALDTVSTPAEGEADRDWNDDSRRAQL